MTLVFANSYVSILGDSVIVDTVHDLYCGFAIEDALQHTHHERRRTVVVVQYLSIRIHA